MPEKVSLNPERVWIRHIIRATSSTPGAVEVLPGRWFAPVVNAGDIYDGLNGRQGWIAGTYERRLREDGAFQLRLPNGPGADGVLHRSRFRLLTDPAYRPGEEWIEFWLDEPGRPVFVGTPVSYRISRTAIEIAGPDAGPILKKIRTGELDVWHHAPRDVFEHHTAVNYAVESADLAPTPAIVSYSMSPASYLGGRFTITSVDDGGSEGLSLYLFGGVNPGEVRADSQFTVDESGSWMVRATIRPMPYNTGRFATLSVKTTGGQALAALTISENSANYFVTQAGTVNSVDTDRLTKGVLVDVRLVCFDGWVRGYVNGRLIGVLPLTHDAAAISLPATCRAHVEGDLVYVREFVVRARRGLLGRGTDKGDYHLPGSPTPGGLRGRYFTEAAYPSGLTVEQRLSRLMSPIDTQVDARQDPSVDYSMPSSWPPSGADTALAVRWTGAIYLDLIGNGRKVRLTCSTGDEVAKVWIGRTLGGQHVARAASGATISANLRDTLGQVAGWFPIVIEYRHFGTSGVIKLEDSPLNGAGAPTAWATVPASRLSPDGCFEDTLRLEAHREVLDQITQAFGHQWTCQPRQLESGEFPGQIVPRVREGRDTEIVIGESDALEYAAQGSVEDTVDELVGDAAGIADDLSAQQLTGDTIDHAAALAHLLAHTDYVGLSEIRSIALFEQRLRSLLALRYSTLEEVLAQPATGGRQLVDSFPLTGTPALFDWEPGHAARIALPDIAVTDDTPRQITSVARAVRPYGRGNPTVSWRQRPKGRRELLKRLQREIRASQRNYQGQLTTIDGNVASNPVSAALTDDASRISLPPNLADIIDLDLIVHRRVAGTAWTVKVNGSSTTFTVNAAGRFPIRELLARDGTNSRMYVQVTGGTGQIEFALQATQRI